jgi:RNA polymerase sigma factor (sigma-70 family)
MFVERVPHPSSESSPNGFTAAAYDRHHARVHGMVRSATRDPELAADVTQEAFLRLLREAQAGRYPADAGAWLYRTASNLAVSSARRASVARRFAPRLVAGGSAPSPEGATLERERSRVMSAALGRLSTTERAALVMAAEGSAGEEIAARLGRTHGATRTLLFRARGRLRVAYDAAEVA